MKKLILLGITLGSANRAFAHQPQPEKFNAQLPAMAAHAISTVK